MLVVLFSISKTASADGVTDASKAPNAALLHERVLRVPGDSERPVALQMTLYTPPGEGPFPLAVMNHGSNGKVPADQQERYRFSFSAYYFLSRGYAVALPMMRGYAGSGGHIERHGCDDLATGELAARDIRGVIDYLRQQPYIDGSRIVVAGQSFGGWNTLSLGQFGVPGVKGLVSFAGGMKASDCKDPDKALVDAAGALGKRVRLPSIWFFGDNDSVFATPLWHAMFESYAAGGSPAELVVYGKFGTDSHNVLGSGDGLRLWVPKLDAFLARIGLPNAPVFPEYLPQPPPPPSHYAAIDDLQALPYFGEAQRPYYQQFLKEPVPRAIAIGLRGAGRAAGGFDPIAQALENCAKTTPGCRLYAVNNDVVWTRQTPVPVPSHFAELTNKDAVPFLNAQGRIGYERFLQMGRPRAFAIAPDGGWDAASMGMDPAAYALKACNAKHPGCRLYAVDGDVVWQQ